MADLPDFNIGETLRGFPGARMRQLVEAVRESLAESDLAGSQAQAKAQSMLRRFQVRALVENGHASALEPFGVLGFSDLGSAVASLDDALAASHQMILEGATPATAHADKMLIVQDGVDAGDSVPACVMGLTLVQVDVTSTSHTKASLINGDATKLASGDSGPATIWWTATGSTGVQWCLVLIGGGSGGSQQGTGLITAAGTAASYDETTVTLTFDEDVELRKFRTNPTGTTLKSVEEPVDACNDADEAITISASDKARLCFWHVDAFGRTCVEPSCNEVDWDGTTPSITTTATQNAVEGSTSTIVTMAATSVIGDEFWSISGGDDSAHFTINESTGALSFTAAKDYSDPDDDDTDGDYLVTVKVVAGNGQSDTLAMTITLTEA